MKRNKHHDESKRKLNYDANILLHKQLFWLAGINQIKFYTNINYPRVSHTHKNIV